MKIVAHRAEPVRHRSEARKQGQNGASFFGVAAKVLDLGRIKQIDQLAHQGSLGLAPTLIPDLRFVLAADFESGPSAMMTTQGLGNFTRVLNAQRSLFIQQLGQNQSRDRGVITLIFAKNRREGETHLFQTGHGWLKLALKIRRGFADIMNRTPKSKEPPSHIWINSQCCGYLRMETAGQHLVPQGQRYLANVDHVAKERMRLPSSIGLGPEQTM